MWELVQIGEVIVKTGPVANFVLIALGIGFLGIGFRVIKYFFD